MICLWELKLVISMHMMFKYEFEKLEFVMSNINIFKILYSTYLFFYNFNKICKYDTVYYSKYLNIISWSKLC